MFRPPRRSLRFPAIRPRNRGSSIAARLSKLIDQAKNATSHDDSLRIGMFGDSTWTDLGGSGVYFHHHLVSMLGGLFGNIAGTRLTGVRQSVNRAPFMRVTKLNVRGSGIDASWGPPGLSTTGDCVAGLPLRGEGGNASAIWTVDGCPNSYAELRDIITDTSLFPVNQQRVEVHCAKRANSSTELRIGYIPTNKTLNAGEAIAQSLNTPIPGLSEAGVVGIEMVSVITPDAANEVAGKPIPQYHFWSRQATTAGAGAVDPPLLVAARILNANPVGCMVDSFSAGGYRAHSWLGGSSDGTQVGNHTNAHKTVAQFEHDIWCFGFGLNDFYNGQANDKTRRNLYDPDGALHRGLIGELIAEKKARGKTVPMIMLIAPPFRDQDRVNAEPDYAANKAIHDAWIDELKILADALVADGHDAFVVDVKQDVANRQFNEQVNSLVGTTDRGAYTNGVNYAVNDRYTFGGRTWICVTAHVGADALAPDQDYTANNPRYHKPASPHLKNNDPVHWTNEGSRLVAQSIASVFSHLY